MPDPIAPRAPLTPTGKRRALALRFISGKYQGGEFPMVPNKEIVVGRSSDLDMVLVEDMVSRKHARIAYEGDQIVIEDLGSTNGTFVNGEKIKKARLKEGDRVLIGTSILKVIASEQSSTEAEARQNLEVVAAKRRSGATRTMSGSIEEVPLPDLLQLFATSKKTGVLVVRMEEDAGRIHLSKGTIAYASINEDPEIPPMKAISRILTWQRGTFDLEQADTRPLPSSIEVSVQEVLMESMRQLDEFTAMRDRLPDLSTRVAVPVPLTSPLRDLAAEELDVLQLAINVGKLSAVLDRSPMSDPETAQILIKLVEKRYLQAV